MSLPDTFTCPERMARALATYIPCPRRIRAEVLGNFTQAPNVARIESFRAEYLAKRAAPEPREAHKPYDGYYPSEAYDRAEDANARFVARLLEARA